MLRTTLVTPKVLLLCVLLGSGCFDPSESDNAIELDERPRERDAAVGRAGSGGKQSGGSGGTTRTSENNQAAGRGGAGGSASGGRSGASGGSGRAGSGGRVASGGRGGAGGRAGAGSRAGAGGSRAGAGGQGGADTASENPACDACVRTPTRAGCFYQGADGKATALIDYCATMPDAATDGPKTGVARSKLCLALLSCVRRTKCNQYLEDPATGRFSLVYTNCYCGLDAQGRGKDPFDCFTGTADMVSGACKSEVEAASETTLPADIQSRLFDPQYAAGVVNNLYEGCQDLHCPLECGSCKAGVMTCGVTYNCFPAPADGAPPLATVGSCGGTSGSSGAAGQSGASAGWGGDASAGVGGMSGAPIQPAGAGALSGAGGM